MAKDPKKVGCSGCSLNVWMGGSASLMFHSLMSLLMRMMQQPVSREGSLSNTLSNALLKNMCIASQAGEGDTWSSSGTRSFLVLV